MAAVPMNGRGSAVFIVTLVLIICATVFVILRLISKWGITRKVTGDDYAIIVAWVLAVGLSGSVMVAAHFGLGLPDSRKPAVHLSTMTEAGNSVRMEGAVSALPQRRLASGATGSR
jgi:hypothetical protein